MDCRSKGPFLRRGVGFTLQQMFQTELTALPGVGPKRAALFEKLEIRTVGQLLCHYPRDYEDLRKVTPLAEAANGQVCGILAAVSSPVKEYFPRRNMRVMKFRVFDGTGVCDVTFFNSPFLHGKITEGSRWYFYGKLEGSGVRWSMTNPRLRRVQGEYEGSIEPIYPLSAGLTRTFVTTSVKNGLALARSKDDFQPDLLPDGLRRRFQLCSEEAAYRNIHFPADQEAVDTARKRLVFEEFLLFQLGLFHLKSSRKAQNLRKLDAAGRMQPFYDSLPFTLTGGQRRAIQDVLEDYQKDVPMNRLVQGDVGSGKTVVAAAAIYAAVKCGCQAVFMAPTEILAKQHFESLEPLFRPLGVVCGLLVGSTGKKESDRLLEELADGRLQVLIGTHALLEDRVQFQNLGLVVTDEQHRFGVMQRAKLSSKGKNPHLLVMSATPIPRTLALMLYGDLDLSVIRELPPGRSPVQTFSIGQRKRRDAYRFIGDQIAQGRQAYFVCPAVEEGEQELASVQAYTEHLQKNVYPNLKIACLHGRMKGSEKEQIMGAFARNELQILVSTTVIEVGVNVPNATVMVVENAERFGLSQLHQLRGRVGRGRHQSYCILFAGTLTEQARKRLEMLCKSNDGFEIARCDLELRGPGDFFGQRQHGLPNFHIANLIDDTELLQKAQKAAKELLEEDPGLARNQALAQAVNRLFGSQTVIFN